VLYNRKLHTKADLAKTILSWVLTPLPFSRIPSDDLIILNYHSVPRKFLPNFERQIGLFHQKYRVISPVDLPAYGSGRLAPDARRDLLITFDDGMKNQYQAAKILDKYRIKAVFFVNPGFISEPSKSQADYYRSHIRSTINPYIDSEEPDLCAMSWQELRQMREAGHEIASHSFTHTLRKESGERERYYEIVESKRTIEHNLDMNDGDVRSFCGPVDSLLSVGVDSAKLIMKHYRYFYSTFPGSNKGLRNPFALKRVHVECYWMWGTVKYQLSRFEWVRWKKRVNSFENEVIRPAAFAGNMTSRNK
jgi:peptidoglycan/xylan/chitin deacetylase (PgdA/CDA1 family)